MNAYNYRYISFEFLSLLLDVVFCAVNGEFLVMFCETDCMLSMRNKSSLSQGSADSSSGFKFALTMFIFCLFAKVSNDL